MAPDDTVVVEEPSPRYSPVVVLAVTSDSVASGVVVPASSAAVVVVDEVDEVAVFVEEVVDFVEEVAVFVEEVVDPVEEIAEEVFDVDEVVAASAFVNVVAKYNGITTPLAFVVYVVMVEITWALLFLISALLQEASTIE